MAKNGILHRTELFGGSVNGGPLMRLSFAGSLIKPRTNDDGVEKYTCALIVKRDAQGVDQLQKAVAECVRGAWPNNGEERFKKGLIKNPILAGDGKEAHDKDGNLRDGLGPEFIFIRPSSVVKPKLFDKDANPADPEDVQSGYWGYPVLNAFAWHHPQSGDGVSFGISMFQVTEKDEILGGGGGGSPEDFIQRVQSGAKEETGPAKDAGDMFG